MQRVSPALMTQAPPRRLSHPASNMTLRSPRMIFILPHLRQVYILESHLRI